MREDLSVRLWRITLGLVGVAGIAYGAKLILTKPKDTMPVVVAEWIVGAVVIHDAIIAPVVLGIGFLLSRTVPPRARAYLQGGLTAGALITLIALPQIYRKGKTAQGSTLLLRDYRANLLWLLLIVAVLTVLAYAVRVVRDRVSSTKARPVIDQHSAG